jgi:hypothetical protein
MKNTIQLFCAVMLTAIFSMNTFSQNVETDMNARANVLSALTITKNQDVDFKMISATTPGVVQINPNGTGSYIGQGATPGRLTISGSQESEVLISYPSGVILTANEGATSLAYSMHVFGAVDNNAEESLEMTLEGSAGVDIPRTLCVTQGNYYLFVGGSLGGSIGNPEALSSQAIGEYTGSLTFEIRYN